MPRLLSDSEIVDGLGRLGGWERQGDEIRRSVGFASFADAIAFVVRVGFLAEAHDHHPDIDIRWRTVHLVLSTHSEGGITDLDLTVAAGIDEIARGGGATG